MVRVNRSQGTTIAPIAARTDALERGPADLPLAGNDAVAERPRLSASPRAEVLRA